MPINHPAIEAYLETLLEQRAEAGKDWLIEALSQEGTGILHHGNPRRSSKVDEYPAEQRSKLKASIGQQPAGRLARAIGSFASEDAEGYAEAVELESREPAAGGRHFIEMAAADPEFRRAILTGKP